MLGHLPDGGGNLLCQIFQLVQGGDVDDEWVVLGATLGCKNLCNGSFVQSICRQTVKIITLEKKNL